MVALNKAFLDLLSRRSDPGDWPEDAEQENGEYECSCAICGATFYGHKRRVVCKRHANQATNPPT